MAVMLTCPLCGADAAPGAEPAAGACAGCGAEYAGGGESAPQGVALALMHWGVDDLDPGALAMALFRRDPQPAPAPTAAVTSDRREGFYLWWVFVRPAPEGVAATLRGFAAGA